MKTHQFPTGEMQHAVPVPRCSRLGWGVGVGGGVSCDECAWLALMCWLSSQLLRRGVCQGQQRNIREHTQYDPVQREYAADSRKLSASRRRTLPRSFRLVLCFFLKTKPSMLHQVTSSAKVLSGTAANKFVIWVFSPPKNVGGLIKYRQDCMAGTNVCHI